MLMGNAVAQTLLKKFKRKFPGYISRSIILHPGDLKTEGNLTKYDW